MSIIELPDELTRVLFGDILLTAPSPVGEVGKAPPLDTHYAGRVESTRDNIVGDVLASLVDGGRGFEYLFRPPQFCH